MLQQMRKLPKWVAFILLLPMSVAFIFWGIADIFRGSSDTSIATVGGVQIDQQEFSRDLQNFRRQAVRQNGGQLSPAKEHALEQSTLQQEIDFQALDNAVQNFGVVATDNEVASTIRSIPAFQGLTGGFSEVAFQQVLQQSNYTPQGFTEEMRHEISRDQLVHSGADAATLPTGYVRALISYIGERRAAQYVILPQDAAGAVAPPSDAVLAAFVKAHASQFSTPEYRSVTYASVGLEDIEKQVQITDAQIKQVYDLRKDTYIVPEKRDIQRINFQDEASAKAARAKIDAGAKFEDIAAQQKVSPADLNLGSLAQADLAGQGPAAFALPVNGITQPVKYTFGWSLLRVTKITPGKTTTLDQVKDGIKGELAKQDAQSRLEDVVNAYEDAHNKGDSLEEAAKSSGMHVYHIAAVDPHGLAPDGTKANAPQAADFLDQVFKSDAGNEGDPFASSDGNRYVIKVDGVTPQKLKPLDQVRAQALAAWTEDQRTQKLGALAAQLTRSVSASGNLSAVATQYHAVLASTDALIRSATTPVLSRALVVKLFESKPGSAVYGPTPDGKSYIIARVTGVLHPPLPLGDPRFQQFVQQLSGEVSTDMQESMAKSERAQQGVTVNQSMVDRVLGGEGS